MLVIVETLVPFGTDTKSFVQQSFSHYLREMIVYRTNVGTTSHNQYTPRAVLYQTLLLDS